jgi:hypothetical protein
MKFGQLEINPAENPGVLDTGTWDVSAACQQVREDEFEWVAAAGALRNGAPPPASVSIQVWPASVSLTADAVWFLAALPDGQVVILRVGRAEPEGILGVPLAELPLADGCQLTVYPSDAAVLDRYCRLLRPDKCPQALGAMPRLGIGSRMTTQVWPGMFDAMVRCGMAANTIQNSVRELSLLDDLLAARPPETNYSTAIGLIEMGWTGSTYEGLWVAGVLAALQSGHKLRYGADADHVQVKRGVAGVERAKRVIRAARYYSFYTLDLADVLNYSALNVRSASLSESLLPQNIPDADLRREVLEYHLKPFGAGGRAYQLDAAAVGRFVGKYWEALDTLVELEAYITALKDGVPFDLELTIDEHPPEVGALDCLTSSEEVLFLAREIRRRALLITHLAPNFGQEKGHDYRGHDGLVGLECRVREQFEIASAFGLMLDIHSGDDLSRETWRVFGRATGGKVHFKVSPMLQLIYAEVLQEFHPELFRRWWDDSIAYARREAATGSIVARECLAALDATPDKGPSAKHQVFHFYSFPFVGRRSPQGQFLHRAEFYRLSKAFTDAYQQRISQWLGELAADVFQT